MRYKAMALFTIAVLIMTADAAYAGFFGTVKGWVTNQLADGLMTLAALGITGLLGYLHKLNAARMDKITQTMTETGKFLTVLGSSVKDQNMTREELGEIIKQGTAVITVNIPTPAKYAVDSSMPQPPPKH